MGLERNNDIETPRTPPPEQNNKFDLSDSDEIAAQLNSGEIDGLDHDEPDIEPEMDIDDPLVDDEIDEEEGLETEAEAEVDDPLVDEELEDDELGDEPVSEIEDDPLVDEEIPDDPEDEVEEVAQDDPLVNEEIPDDPDIDEEPKQEDDPLVDEEIPEDYETVPESVSQPETETTQVSEKTVVSKLEVREQPGVSAETSSRTDTSNEEHSESNREYQLDNHTAASDQARLADNTDTTEQEHDEIAVRATPASDRTTNPLDEVKDSDVQERREGLKPEEADKVRELVYSHCEPAKDIANNATKDGTPDGEKNDRGANFTDHNQAHIEQVLEKTTESLDAFVKAINNGKMENETAEGDVHFSSNVDYKVVQAAALSHDTGMSDNGYSMEKDGKTPVMNAEGNYVVQEQNPYDFDAVRNNHTANSALNVLSNREYYKEIGFSDEQIDEMAILCYSHSKSNSGIENLNDSSSWKKGFDRMDAFVDAYTKDHPGAEISYNREHLEGKLDSLATEALALRTGDVARDSGPDAVAQGGNTVHVEKDTVGQNLNYPAEVANAVVKNGDKFITDDKGKQVHIGEQNIVENHTEFKNDTIIHTVTVNDGSYAPGCTTEAIKDHLGEFASAKNGQFVVSVEFDKPWNDATKELLNNWRKNIEEVPDEKTGKLLCPNVDVRFPWDNKEG